MNIKDALSILALTATADQKAIKTASEEINKWLRFFEKRIYILKFS